VSFVFTVSIMFLVSYAFVVMNEVKEEKKKQK
jgi:hypothetical protein